MGVPMYAPMYAPDANGIKYGLSVGCRRVLDNKKGCPSCKGTPVRENAQFKNGNGGASPENADVTCPSTCPCRVGFFQGLWLTFACFCREQTFRRILGDVIDEMYEEVI